MRSLKAISLVVLFVFCLTALCACGKQAADLTGTWKADLSALGENAPEQAAAFCLVFNSDGTGVERLTIGDAATERGFAFSASDGQLKLSYDDGSTDEFSYHLEGSALTLTHDGRSIALTRAA